jgi:hypothetical protein
MSAGQGPRRTELAALAMGVAESTIRKWASRGRITRYGSRQRAEYDLDELFAISTGKAGGDHSDNDRK